MRPPAGGSTSPSEDPAEGQLSGLLKSQLLKRFESCWRACLGTVERMIQVHDAFASGRANRHFPHPAVVDSAAMPTTVDATLEARIAGAILAVGAAVEVGRWSLDRLRR